MLAEREALGTPARRPHVLLLALAVVLLAVVVACVVCSPAPMRLGPYAVAGPSCEVVETFRVGPGPGMVSIGVSPNAAPDGVEFRARRPAWVPPRVDRAGAAGLSATAATGFFASFTAMNHARVVGRWWGSTVVRFGQ